jgi:phage terminase large subunit-like protein
MISVPEASAMITTQSFEPPAGVFRDELSSPAAIRDGRAKVDTLPVLYEFPEAQQKDETFWKDPANWPMVTPNLGRSIASAPGLRLESPRPSSRRGGVRHLGQPASQRRDRPGLHSDRWLGADYWEGASDPTASPSRTCSPAPTSWSMVGIDGGGLDDLLAVCVLGR